MSLTYSSCPMVKTAHLFMHITVMDTVTVMATDMVMAGGATAGGGGGFLFGHYFHWHFGSKGRKRSAFSYCQRELTFST